MFKGVAYGTNVTCPSYTACSDTAEVCTSPSIAYDCAPTCGTCSTDGRFACLNSTAYALCFGGTTPSSSAIGTCATGMFCDITVTAPPFCSTNPAVIFFYSSFLHCDSAMNFYPKEIPFRTKLEYLHNNNNNGHNHNSCNNNNNSDDSKSHFFIDSDCVLTGFFTNVN